MSKPSKGKVFRGVVSITGVTDLKPGDEVVVVQPLKVPVLSSRTGRVLGLDEKVLGRGTVVKEEDSLVVQLEHIKRLKADIKPTIKGVVTFGSKRQRTNDVLVKLVNGRMK